MLSSSRIPSRAGPTIWLLFFWFAAVGGALAQSRILDIDATNRTGSAAPRLIGNLNNRAFFSVMSGVDLELWSTDGTTAGTSNLGPLGVRSAGPGVSAFGALFFPAEEPGYGTELFRTRGTRATTTRFTNGVAGGTGTSPTHLTLHNGALYFFGRTTGGVQLWRSDGTVAGTAPIRSFNGSGFPGPTGFLPLGNLLVFAADGGSGIEPWVTDGTNPGTVQLADIRRGTGSSIEFGVLPRFAAAVYDGSTNRVVFHGAPTQFQNELWVTDGTPGGTHPLIPGSTAPYYGQIVSSGNSAYCVLGGGSSSALWETDGTAGGTRRVFAPGTSLVNPDRLTDHAGSLYFVAEDQGIGRELHRYDGASIQCVADLAPGPASAFQIFQPSVGFESVGQDMLVFADDGTHGVEPWNVRGTTMTRLADIAPGATDSSRPGFPPTGSVNGRFLFEADDTRTGTELWVSDGTPSGTSRLVDAVTATPDSNPEDLVAWGRDLVFSAEDGVHGREPWVSDGSPGGTTMLADLRPGPEGSNPQAFASTEGFVFFAADDGTRGVEPWVSDGTAAGTRLLRDIYPGALGSGIYDAVAIGNRVFFCADDQTHGAELWMTDGTTSGTRLVRDIAPGTGSALTLVDQPMLRCGERLLFSATSPGTGQELWISDGTAAGTRLVRDINPNGDGNPNLAAAADIGGSVVFFADDGVSGMEPWATDGTPGNTRRLADLRPGATGSGPEFFDNTRAEMVAMGGRAWFFADDGTNGREPWVSDGTAQGTLPLGDVRPGAASSRPESYYPELIVATRARVWWFLDDGSTGIELWRSSVSAPTPVRVTDLAPGRGSSATPHSFGGQFEVQRLVGAGNDDVLVFGATDGTRGYETWVADGRTGTVRLLSDAAPAAASLAPIRWTRARDRVFFSGTDRAAGRELWAVPATALGARLAEAYGRGCPGSTGAPLHLEALGVPTIPSPGYSLRLTGAQPTASIAWFFGVTEASTHFPTDCRLLVQPLTGIPGTTDTNGVANLPLALSTATVPGLPFYVQAIVLDPGGSLFGNGAASNGVQTLPN